VLLAACWYQPSALPSLLAARRALAAVAARGELVVLIGSAAWLVPIQRRLAASSPGPQVSAADAGRLRARRLRGALPASSPRWPLFLAIAAPLV
jgi:hypothetical protein